MRPLVSRLAARILEAGGSILRLGTITDGQALVRSGGTITSSDIGGAAASALAAHVAAGDPHTGYQLESEKGAASGYASLDGDTRLPFAQLPLLSVGLVRTVATPAVSSGGQVAPDYDDILLTPDASLTLHASIPVLAPSTNDVVGRIVRLVNAATDPARPITIPVGFLPAGYAVQISNTVRWGNVDVVLLPGQDCILQRVATGTPGVWRVLAAPGQGEEYDFHKEMRAIAAARGGTYDFVTALNATTAATWMDLGDGWRVQRPALTVTTAQFDANGADFKFTTADHTSRQLILEGPPIQFRTNLWSWPEVDYSGRDDGTQSTPTGATNSQWWNETGWASQVRHDRFLLDNGNNSIRQVRTDGGGTDYNEWTTSYTDGQMVGDVQWRMVHGSDGNLRVHSDIGGTPGTLRYVGVPSVASHRRAASMTGRYRWLLGVQGNGLVGRRQIKAANAVIR